MIFVGQNSRIMRSNTTTVKTSYTRAKYHSSPPLLLHSRDTKLRHQKRTPTVRFPGILEIFNRDFGDGFDAALKRQARVVEENGRLAHIGDYGGMERSDLLSLSNFRKER
jgi:hypothetical protein